MAGRVLMLNPVCTQVLTRPMSRFDDHAANSWSKAIQFFLLETQDTDIADLSMDVKDTDVLRDIHQIIEVPHMAQELLSSERTPTLSMTLPAYGLLTSKWTQLQSTIWELSHYIGVGLEAVHQQRTKNTYIWAFDEQVFSLLNMAPVLTFSGPNYSCQHTSWHRKPQRNGHAKTLNMTGRMPNASCIITKTQGC